MITNIFLILFFSIDTIFFVRKISRSKKYRNYTWRFIPYSWLFFKNDITEDQKITKEIMKHYN